MHDIAPTAPQPEESARSDARQPPPFYNDLEATLAEAWRLLRRGVEDRKSAFHTPALASIRLDGSPSVRSVVLRAVDAKGRKLRFHTDRRSAKAAELDADPRVALHFYDPAKKIQLRLDGTAMLHSDDAFAAEAWAATRPFSRLCYQADAAPGDVVAKPASGSGESIHGTDDSGRDNFVAVSVSVRQLEWLYLAAQGHRRARFSLLTDGSKANWVAP